jgi:PAS domain S-box-containing protein
VNDDIQQLRDLGLESVFFGRRRHRTTNKAGCADQNQEALRFKMVLRREIRSELFSFPGGSSRIRGVSHGVSVVIDKQLDATQTVNPMLDEDLQDQAALYALGVLTEREREHFALLLEFHDEVKDLVRDLEEITAAATLATIRTAPTAAPAALKGRIMDLLDKRSQEQRHGFVMAGPDGLVRWVNPEFTEMCGYNLEELRGKKLGPILQGELTDPETAHLMKKAVNERRVCEAELINYHKNGTPYWVKINITPFFDPNGETRWLVAREQELKDRPIPAAA